jgi:serine/threonine-protein kinase RsbW
MAETPVRLSFPARSEYLLLARLAVAGVARGLPFGQEEIVDLKLAVTEACGNVVRHAYADGDGAGEVEIDLVPGPDRLEIVVEDQGSGIELPLSEPPPAPTESGGMGLSIMRTVVDELQVERGPGGRGTVVHMTKLATSRGRGRRLERRGGRDSSKV